MEHYAGDRFERSLPAPGAVRPDSRSIGWMSSYPDPVSNGMMIGVRRDGPESKA
jgi:hypothetical protein